MSLTFDCWPQDAGFCYTVDAPEGTEFSFRVVASGSGGHQISKELHGVVTDPARQFYEAVFFTVMNVGIMDASFDVPNSHAANTEASREENYIPTLNSHNSLATLRNSTSRALFGLDTSFNPYPYPYPYP